MDIDWTEIIIAFIQLILVPLLGWALVELAKMARAKAANIKNEGLRQITFDAIGDAEAAVALAVRETQQTFVSTIRNGGEWSAALGKQAFELSSARALEIMGAAAKEAITARYGDLMAWVTARIEAEVLALKANAPPEP